jgi:hypothetical protein
MSGVWGPVLGALGILGALIAGWFAAKAKGKSEAVVESTEQKAKDNEALAVQVVKNNQSAIAEQNKTVVSANEIDQDVNRMSDIDVLNELHDRWGTTTNNDNGDKK